MHSAALGVIADAYGDDGRDLKWVKRVAGVSAGTFAAVLVACGLSVEQVQEQAANLPLSRITEGMSTIQVWPPPALRPDACACGEPQNCHQKKRS